LWQVVEERVGTSPDSADAERQFVWGKRYIDDLIVRDRNADSNRSFDERLYACQDANWNVTAIVDDQEVVQERYAYSAYGVTAFLTASFSDSLSSGKKWERLYCGYYQDVETALFNVRHRIYTPLVAEWLQRDPLGLTNLADIVSLYRYLGSSPLMGYDPYGLAECELEVCERPIAPDPTKTIGHIYIKLKGSDGKTIVFGGAGYPAPADGKCSGNILRIHEGPWTPQWGQGPNPEYPKNDDDKKQHVCNPYVLNASCDDVIKCMEDTAKKIAKCCIPYDATPNNNKPDQGCNSNCAARWLLESCTAGLVTRGPKGTKPGQLPHPPSFGDQGPIGSRPTPGWNASIPSCLKGKDPC
jgi:RHS repeat-associated protein